MSFLIHSLLLFVLASWTYQSTPEDGELELRLRRNFGYSSGSGSIQGSFTLTATGPEDLARVAFFIDEQLLGELEEPPFQLRFSTGEYPLGEHSLQATGFVQNGAELISNEIQVRFVTSEEGWQAGLRIIVPVLVVVGAAILLSILVPTLWTRGKTIALPPGAQRNYGSFGGAICRNCSRPFGLHIYGVNLGLGKYDRCPYCGKWGLQRRAGMDALLAAENAELEVARGQAFPAGEVSKEDHEKELDDSRFLEL